MTRPQALTRRGNPRRRGWYVQALPPRPDGPPPVWSYEQVHTRNREQAEAERTGGTPNTCPVHRGVALFATPHGWICAATPDCPYRPGATP